MDSILSPILEESEMVRRRGRKEPSCMDILSVIAAIDLL
jgi:hypothetical protein